MSKPISPEQQVLQAHIEEARTKIAAIEKERLALDSQLEDMAAQRQQYELLEHICESLDRLDQMGASSLFWGEQQAAAQDVVNHVVRARSTAATFVQKVAAVEQEREGLNARVRDEEWKIADFAAEIAEIREQEEAAKNEFVVYREMGKVYRPMVLPWHGDPEDERRFRKTMFITLAIVLLFALLTRIWVFPPRQKQQVVEIPKSLVQLVQKERPKPPPPPEQRRLEEKKEEPPKETAKATTKEKQEARAKATKSGVLAFKSGFSDLMQDSVSLKLGADARITTNGQKAVGTGNVSARSLVTAQGQTSGSGGIRTGSLSRDVGGGGGKQITGVAFTRVESGVAGMQGGNGDRPLSDGPGPSRTDEEIQIVFDKYKAALYRIYQRELRNDPTLRGKMVLKITIEPSGSVSACAIQSSDLASAVLKNEVVERVKKFSFGGKDGVARITILYPIDFLPAS